MSIKSWNVRDGIHKVKRKDIEVEDHGNGFMVVGTNMPDEARKVLVDYVDDVSEYGWACPTHYEGRSACWLTNGPGHNWEGSVDALGRPLPRITYN